jgi:hypothetical protein
MFKKLFGKSEQKKIQRPEIMGLHVGGSFEIDPLKLKLIVPQLTIENPAVIHLIQSVGEVILDSNAKILRFYTLTIGNESQWKNSLSQTVSQPTYQLEGHTFTRVWDAVGDESPPVAMTEKTYEEDEDTSLTDQFIMLYERELEGDEVEALMVSAEEKIIGQNHDRCLVTSTGFNIQPTDIRING